MLGVLGVLGGKGRGEVPPSCSLWVAAQRVEPVEFRAVWGGVRDEREGEAGGVEYGIHCWFEKTGFVAVRSFASGLRIAVGFLLRVLGICIQAGSSARLTDQCWHALSIARAVLRPKVSHARFDMSEKCRRGRGVGCQLPLVARTAPYVCWCGSDGWW